MGHDERAVPPDHPRHADIAHFAGGRGGIDEIVAIAARHRRDRDSLEQGGEVGGVGLVGAAVLGGEDLVEPHVETAVATGEALTVDVGAVGFGRDMARVAAGLQRSYGRPMIVVDGNNVIGTVPDGWWRDRRAAARRLLARLQCLHGRTGDELVVVFDVVDPELPEGDHAGVAVRYATRRGRNAADDRIRELVAGHGDEPVEVVTSDRALAADLHAATQVVSATSFLSRLDEAGC